MRQLKIVVEQHPDGYVAYPVGMKGVIVGEGDTYEDALADVESAIQFHDLDEWGEIWEDIYDTLVSESRRGEPTVSWDELKAEMDREGQSG